MAERLIEGCEHCNPDGAEIPFDSILDRLTGSDPQRDRLPLGRIRQMPVLPGTDNGKDAR